MCFLVDELPAAHKVLLYGIWCHCVFCGAFGGK